MSNLDDVHTHGLGLMNFTARNPPVEKSIAFKAMALAVEKNLPAPTFFNGGVFYGPNDINLIYIKEFFEKYPQYRQHVVISIKGAFDFTIFQPTIDRASINESIDHVLKYIPDLDIFEPARLDPAVPLEETIGALDAAIDAGKIKGFSLSEVGASSIAKASKLTKHGISAVEVEFSVFSREILENGVAKLAGELDIPIIAYSPLARGLLTGTITSAKDVPEGDMRHRFDRFSDDIIKKNHVIVEGVVELAKKKNVTPAQLALAWIEYYSGKTVDGVKYPKIISIPSSSSEQRVQENFADVHLTEEEFLNINSLIKDIPVHGSRYNANFEKYLSV